MRRATFYSAYMETRSFTFEAYGTTEAEALEVLRLAVLKHCRQTGADREYMLEGLQDITPQPRTVGHAYRDRERFR